MGHLITVRSKKIDPEHIKYLQDILLELNDIGFKTQVYPSSYLRTVDNVRYLNIDIGGKPSFKIQDVLETIYSLNSYMISVGYKITRISYSRFSSTELIEINLPVLVGYHNTQIENVGPIDFIRINFNNQDFEYQMEYLKSKLPNLIKV